MCAKHKALWFVLLPALLVLTTGPGQAVPKTRDQCYQDDLTCLGRCGTQKTECDRNELSGCESQRILCKDNCDTALKDCLKDAKKAGKVPKTKVQPKVQPGGAETPQGTSPKVKPEGGVQRE